MTQDKFQIVGDQLVGRGLSFDVVPLVAVGTQGQVDVDRRALLVEIVEATYLQGRGSVLPAWDDRFDLSCAVETLRALAVVVGPFSGDRHRHVADILARMLQEQGP